MRRHLAFFIWITTILIIGMGLLAVYSASYHNPRVSDTVFTSQLVFAIVGLVLIQLLSQIDYRKFFDLSYFFYGGCVFLLLLVMVVGRHALGAQRWINFGPLSFQPSELAKLGLIFALGRYFSENISKISFSFLTLTQRLWRDLFFPFFLALLPMVLIFKQPDLGTAILMFGIFLIMLFVSGIHYRYYLSFLGVCLCLVPFAWHILKSYQRDRLLVFLNPNIDPLGAGYTIIQSKIAIGSGLLFGKGWLAGTQNQLNFLPERHTDFIFSVIGEEWGLMGTIFLLACYAMLITCGFIIAEQVKDKFGTQVTIGIVGILTLQVAINIGMVLGLCPVVGITLPLVSYGRTSFLIFVLMIGFLLNLSKRRTIF